MFLLVLAGLVLVVSLALASAVIELYIRVKSLEDRK